MIVPKLGYRVDDGRYIQVPFPVFYNAFRHSIKWIPEIENWHVMLLPFFKEDVVLEPKRGCFRENLQYHVVEFPFLYSAWKHFLVWHPEYEAYEVRFRCLEPLFGYRRNNGKYEKVDWPADYTPEKHTLKWDECNEQWNVDDRPALQLFDRWRLDKSYFDLRYNIHNFSCVQDFIKSYADGDDCDVVRINMAKKETNNDLVKGIVNLGI